jgi:hypothetical protein
MTDEMMNLRALVEKTARKTMLKAPGLSGAGSPISCVPSCPSLPPSLAPPLDLAKDFFAADLMLEGKAF